MGKLYKNDKSGQVLSVTEITLTKKAAPPTGITKANTQKLVQAPAVEKTGKIVQRNLAPKAPAQKTPAKSQPANEIVLKQTVKVPDTQKTATFTNYRKAVDFLQAEAIKPGFTIPKLEGLIEGEVRTSVLKVAEKIRAELTTQ